MLPSPKSPFVHPDRLRASFSEAMSEMYRGEVPAYGALLDLVADVNRGVLGEDAELRERLVRTDSLERLSAERHGAIRLGTGDELRAMRRVLAVMGMQPVGYYDLSTAGIPVHATAFRPVGETALKANPFRIFTSVLRLDLVADRELREAAAAVLGRRRIFTDAALSLVSIAESQGGLDQEQGRAFLDEILSTFRWHGEANVERSLYERLHAAHRLVADVVSFRGPHINHLTPRTLDIDAVQEQMPRRGIIPKAVIEGPPRRSCPILLRQTSFKAQRESVAFRSGGTVTPGSHTARFGEIEQRGAALTRTGRALYDRLLAEARSEILPAPDGSNAAEYGRALERAFGGFPDSWDELRRRKLAYFEYGVARRDVELCASEASLEELVRRGLIVGDPIVYEDFLPVSAAGIFQSNLGDAGRQEFETSPSRQAFEDALGCRVLDEFEHYAMIEAQSLDRCARALGIERIRHA